MSIVIQEFGFGEYEFGSVPFGTSLGLGNQGMQVEFKIDSSTPIASQAEFEIDKAQGLGMQFQGFNVDSTLFQNMQVQYAIDTLSSVGFQILGINTGGTNSTAMQFEGIQGDKPEALGSQVVFTVTAQGSIGGQVDSIIGTTDSNGSQYNAAIETKTALGMELKGDKIAHKIHETFGSSAFGSLPFGHQNICAQMGCQIEFNVAQGSENNAQVQFKVETQNEFGMQTQFVIDAQAPLNMQFSAQSVSAVAMQFLSTLYNTTNLRILCEFPSRGLGFEQVGNNAFGNPIGTGQNWQASSTEPGDFGVFNLNTDVVEQVYRSATGTTSITLDCDTELNQGVFLDTLAILNHNLTRSATIQLIGSTSSTFATTDFVTNLQVLENDMYYIAPDLPLTGLRYWRFQIDDPTNTDTFISIGTIIFGAAQIFSQECFVDEIGFQFQDFADKVKTEGFTNVSNSRTIKKLLDLEFRFLNFAGGNFTILRDLFKNQRTTLKCLYVPTPDADDQNITSRFAVFGKLSTIPSETHNYKSDTGNYVSFNIQVDEAE